MTYCMCFLAFNVLRSTCAAHILLYTQKHAHTSTFSFAYNVRGGSLFWCRAPHFIPHVCIYFPGFLPAPTRNIMYVYIFTGRRVLYAFAVRYQSLFFSYYVRGGSFLFCRTPHYILHVYTCSLFLLPAPQRKIV